jgi:LysM repeat protein
VPGDVISAIARRFGTTVEAIRSANGLPDDEIRSGVVLRIPVAPTDPYVVKPGETASGIAAAFGVTLRALEQANGVPDGGLTQLTAGATIRVPKR